jgi:two-component system cell cycle response regulator
VERASGAYTSMERIRLSLENETFEADSETFSVTFTAGIAEFDAQNMVNMTVEDLIHEADNALFEAKKLGRNRVEFRREHQD